VTPTPTPTPTTTPTATPISTPSPIATATSTPRSIATSTSTPRSIATSTPRSIATATPISTPSSIPTSTSTSDEIFGRSLREYHAALRARHLGLGEIRREDVARRVAEAEQQMSIGRLDEAVSRLAEIVEHPDFDAFAHSEDGRAAVYRLGDALATAGIMAPARAYLRELVEPRDAWSGYGSARSWAMRAVRRLVDIALDDAAYDEAARDLETVPLDAPEEVRGEISYVNGRQQEAAGRPDAALIAYASVAQRSRFWAQATYLSGLILVERGNFKRAEDLLCKVADPRRSATTTPVFADEKFFAVRDLARLGLGRIAHEQGRNDDARYYYYLVPADSDRLAEALYEAATTRYEKKDYDGARDLLDELAALHVHHPYEDEAWVLGAWVDLARCRFADADIELAEFLARYQPVRDAARRIAESDSSTQRLLAAVHSGADADGAAIGGASLEVVRAVAALVRVDPAYGRVLRRRAVLEHEASGLVYAAGTLADMQRALGTNGGVRPAGEFVPDATQEANDVRDAVRGVEQQIADLDAAHAPAEEVARLRRQLADIEREAGGASAGTLAPIEPGAVAPGHDLPDLLRDDSSEVADLERRIAIARADLERTERLLARDALHRLDLRLSRLLRRARLGRIESVLGRKRALEVEVDAIRLGYLPQDAVDSLDAARYLEDNEEYWPFEGDDWSDEYVGGEIK
jgi:tetratricopeptide (TPR) repeat protein